MILMNPNRNFILLFLTVILSCNICSQKISYNFFSGVNLTNTNYIINNNGDKYSGRNNDNRLALHIGFGLDVPINTFLKNNTNLSIEIQYSEQGDSFYFDDKRQFNKINQLNIPIKIKTELLKNLNLGLGGYVGYLLYIEEYFREDENSYNNIDLGLAGSIEYKFLKKIGVKIQFLYGFKDVLDRKFGDREIYHNLNNKVLQIGLNYKF
jgi:hypothetical protein